MKNMRTHGDVGVAFEIVLHPAGVGFTGRVGPVKPGGLWKFFFRCAEIRLGNDDNIAATGDDSVALVDREEQVDSAIVVALRMKEPRP